MQVNICHRLIKNMIEKGEVFVSTHGGGYYNVLTRNIPKGVYASKPYVIGQNVKKLEGQLLLHRTKNSICIGNGMHIVDDYGQFINHSFEPNTKIEFNNIIAIKNIEKYEEITIGHNESYEPGMDSFGVIDGMSNIVFPTIILNDLVKDVDVD